jgi:hypothetical protein
LHLVAGQSPGESQVCYEGRGTRRRPRIHPPILSCLRWLPGSPRQSRKATCPIRAATDDAQSPGTPSVANWKRLEGDDAFPTYRACHGYGPELSQRSVGADVEFIDDPVPAGLDVEVLPTNGR